MKFPVVTAHTGCMGTEANSIPSVEEGIRRGADIIEVDVRATKDGVAVLAHDDCVRTSSGGILIFEQADYSELLDSGVRLVRLTEALELIRDSGRTANLDLKTGSALDAMVRTVRDMKLTDDVFVTGCDKDMTLEITGRYRGMRVLMNVETEPLPGGSDYAALIRKWCADATEAGSGGLNLSYRNCTEELVVYAARRCLPVSLYTVDEQALMKIYAGMGVFSMTTNRVDLLVELKSRAAGRGGSLEKLFI